MRLYENPMKAFLFNDLVAYDSEDNDKQLIYHFIKGYVTVLGEFKSSEYVGGVACIIFNHKNVISVAKGILRFIDEKDF